MRRAVGLLLIVLLLGCVTTLTPAEESVRITSNPDVVKECQYLGEVVGKDHAQGGMLLQGAAEKRAHQRLKRNAHAMGADTVFLVSSSTGMSGSTQRGEAYRCKK